MSGQFYKGTTNEAVQENQGALHAENERARYIYIYLRGVCLTSTSASTAPLIRLVSFANLGISTNRAKRKWAQKPKIVCVISKFLNY